MGKTTDTAPVFHTTAGPFIAAMFRDGGTSGSDGMPFYELAAYVPGDVVLEKDFSGLRSLEEIQGCENFHVWAQHLEMIAERMMKNRVMDARVQKEFFRLRLSDYFRGLYYDFSQWRIDELADLVYQNTEFGRETLLSEVGSFCMDSIFSPWYPWDEGADAFGEKVLQGYRTFDLVFLAPVRDIPKKALLRQQEPVPEEEPESFDLDSYDPEEEMRKIRNSKKEAVEKIASAFHRKGA